MDAKAERFYNTIPNSNYIMPNGQILVFYPDKMNPVRGVYITTDPEEIAELKKAIKSGAPMITQVIGEEQVDIKAVEGLALSPEDQAAAVARASAAVDNRRESAKNALQNLNQQESARASGNSTQGISQSPAQLAAARAASAKAGGNTGMVSSSDLNASATSNSPK